MRLKRNLCVKCGGKSKLIKYRDDLLAVCYRITCCDCKYTIRDDGIDNDEVIKRITIKWNKGY
jgi:hypothetical protein